MGLSEAHIVHHESKFEKINTAGIRLITWLVIAGSAFLAMAFLAAIFA